VKRNLRPRQPRRPAARYPDLATYIAKTHDSQASIARAMGVSQAQISRILSGAIPRLELRIRLAAYARIPIESFTWEAAKRRGLVA
jgi:transcriptional regulator with XRE-family HTH domain